MVDGTVLRDVNLRFDAAGNLEQMWAVVPVRRHSRAARTMTALAHQVQNTMGAFRRCSPRPFLWPGLEPAPDGTVAREVDVFAAEDDGTDDRLVAKWSVTSDGPMLTLTDIDSL